LLISVLVAWFFIVLDRRAFIAIKALVSRKRYWAVVSAMGFEWED
jgi:hypothetical protein